MPRGAHDDPVEAVLPGLYALCTIDEFPRQILPLVLSLVGGDKCDFTVVDLETGDFRVVVDPEPTEIIQLRSARAAHMHEHPVLRHFFSSPSVDARTISDFLTPTEFLSPRWWVCAPRLVRRR
jgi:hypothetical protein